MLPPLKADSKLCSSDVGSRGLGTTRRLLGAFCLLSSRSDPNEDWVCQRQAGSLGSPQLPEFLMHPHPTMVSAAVPEFTI